MKHKPESIARIRESAQGRKRPPPRSDEHRANISAALKGRPGRPKSQEERAKMSEARKGRKLSPEHRAKIGEGNRGKKMSPESIEKMVAARLANGSYKRRRT